MKLFYSNTSPYSRKVRLVLIEKGLDDLVETEQVNPFEEDPSFRAINPLGKIPALMLDNGETLFDSPVICRYLDSLAKNSPLIPSNSDMQWTVLRWEALADGLLDAAYNIVMERRRPATLQSPNWVAQWTKEIEYSMQDMEQRVNDIGSDTPITLAHLSTAVAVGYLDFRLPELLYSSAYPQVAEYQHLQNWYERFKTRASMLATQPTELST